MTSKRLKINIMKDLGELLNIIRSEDLYNGKMNRFQADTKIVEVRNAWAQLESELGYKVTEREAEEWKTAIEKMDRNMGTKGRCGKCKACLAVEKAKSVCLRTANPPFSHASDDTSMIWNDVLIENPCEEWD